MKTTNITTALKNIFFATLLITGFWGCSNSCDNEEPRARINNYGTDKASVQIKTSGGSTENINNIETGQSSDWRSYAAGVTEFTITIQGGPDTLVIQNMLNCWEYDIIIDSLNQVSTVPQERD